MLARWVRDDVKDKCGKDLDTQVGVTKAHVRRGTVHRLEIGRRQRNYRFLRRGGPAQRTRCRSRGTGWTAACLPSSEHGMQMRCSGCSVHPLNHQLHTSQYPNYAMRRFAEYLGMDRHFEFTQQDMSFFRRRVSAELLAKCLRD